MGTVHGVYLKYVGLSVLSFAGYSWMLRNDLGERLALGEFLANTRQSVIQSASLVIRVFPVLIFGYSTVINGMIAVLFKMERGMWMLGKNHQTGEIPRWSYFVFFPFHIPTMVYTFVHTNVGTQMMERDGKDVEELVPVATLVQPGWWIGGCHANELDKDWAGVIDLTVEFPESTIRRTQAYLSIPTWDGVPASPDQIEQAAQFAIAAHEKGDVLVHCAHGRGRSTTVMCACLVKAGLFPNWIEAFEKGIKPYRPCCKLNKRMKSNLTLWQAAYEDSTGKKIH